MPEMTTPTHEKCRLVINLMGHFILKKAKENGR